MQFNFVSTQTIRNSLDNYLASIIVSYNFLNRHFCTTLLRDLFSTVRNFILFSNVRQIRKSLLTSFSLWPVPDGIPVNRNIYIDLHNINTLYEFITNNIANITRWPAYSVMSISIIDICLPEVFPKNVVFAAPTSGRHCLRGLVVPSLDERFGSTV